ncbi:MBL fold metallo-hydrolase [Rossellomorea aquimaris]|uniref:Glyoxylase-like metal-dependent hydrolase (Beta-lactamase superfamily II) n=1 Tax=Rossellomorea aquimaris TaxID=189382 RepID=A0A366EMT2_9BACI|nr:MBL fold metallo-hydrolase [Rossellomorea aquimaris]RBP03703.1 glyoxylase-like metal-dependent hydrolase (beta-lactamase superfamily II) [Rossellomorea aquimaris]
MKLQNLAEHCYAFTGSVTIGYCIKEGKGLLIDSGLDASSMKKVIKILSNEGLPLDYCVITHAHADHFGGAHFLKNKHGTSLFAPKLEKAIMENSILEPIYLFNGANPINDLRNKFLEGQSVVIDDELKIGENSIGPFTFEAIDLPGHSYGQVGVLIEDVLYAADSYFGRDTLVKHVIPFIIDADQTLDSLEKLLHIPCKGAIPGHGDYEENFVYTVQENIDLHEERMKSLIALVNESSEGYSFERVVKEYLKLHKIAVTNVGQWLLFRTSVTAYLTSFERKKLLSFTIRENELIVIPH